MKNVLIEVEKSSAISNLGSIHRRASNVRCIVMEINPELTIVFYLKKAIKMETVGVFGVYGTSHPISMIVCK